MNNFFFFTEAGRFLTLFSWFTHYILDSYNNSKYDLNNYFILHPTRSLSLKQLTTMKYLLYRYSSKITMRTLELQAREQILTPLISQEANTQSATLHNLLPHKARSLTIVISIIIANSCYLETPRKTGWEKTPSRVVFPRKSRFIPKNAKKKAGVQQYAEYIVN